MAERSIYKVVFHNGAKIYEIYAEQIFQSDMYGFIEVEDFIFGERSQMIVDPAEEKLKAEFEGVRRTFIPMHTVIRIDEVEKEGVCKISEVTGNVTPINFAGQNLPGKGTDRKK